jgi:glycerol-3-phosphate dehydrogenase subunit C
LNDKKTTDLSKKQSPEYLMRKVVDACTDCDCCRYILDTSCQLFPEIYALWDQEKETGEQINAEALRHLADLCNYCALCPCPNIREDIISAKTGFIDREGLAPHIRTLEDVERVGKLCGAVPSLTNLLLQQKTTSSLIKRFVGINPERKLPVFPKEDFPTWAKRRGLDRKNKPGDKRKVAYFAGCTARYLFPDVPKAVVDVLEHCGVTVYYPEQHCCGMPSMLEGDRDLTLQLADQMITQLAEIVADGYEIICSCSTCGYMLKHALREWAYYSDAYQDLVGGDERHMIIPEETGPNQTRHRKLAKHIYNPILKDQGYFSRIDPLKRIQVAENTYDLGEYLLKLSEFGDLDQLKTGISEKMVYYPPCHLREQEIGMPFLKLLSKIPNISIESFPSTFYCCGIAGIMGFKKDFHDASIQMGRPLMDKISQLDPDIVVTDCLSCRLQFNQLSDYTVRHPVEILWKAIK